MKPIVGIIMGSKSDWPIMSGAAGILEEMNVPFEVRVLSAHRDANRVFEYAETASDRGLEVIIAGAGMAAHLPGVLASKTSVPILGVPINAGSLGGMDALLSMVQMPSGVPVATFSIGSAGAKNAALFAVTILAKKYSEFAEAVDKYRTKQREKHEAPTDPRETE